MQFDHAAQPGSRLATSAVPTIKGRLLPTLNLFFSSSIAVRGAALCAEEIRQTRGSGRPRDSLSPLLPDEARGGYRVNVVSSEPAGPESLEPLLNMGSRCGGIHGEGSSHS
jgi:hypothetical protein